MFRWYLLRVVREYEEILAQGSCKTIEEAQRSVVEAEGKFPIGWVPEMHYRIRYPGGKVEEGGVCWTWGVKDVWRNEQLNGDPEGALDDEDYGLYDNGDDHDKLPED